MFVRKRANSMIKFVLGFMALITAVQRVEADNGGNIKNFAKVECGRVLVKRVSKIVGGGDAHPGEFPWMASIQSQDGNHFCCGFVVNERFVGTAAHCFLNYIFNPLQKIEFRVILGEHHLEETRSKNSIEYDVEELNVHPNFTVIGYVNDIALIRLNRSIKFTPFIQPLCLPNENFDYDLSNLVTGDLVIAGWGKIAENQTYEEWKKKPTMLKKAEIPLWKNDLCQDVFLKHGMNFPVTSTHLCAGNEERDTCQGDSGTALLTTTKYNEKQWIALGLASSGKGCAQGLPGIYTRSSQMISWVEEIVNSTS